MGKKIMVVDDSRMIALQMQNLLEDTEYEIAAYCRNGEDALAKYGEIRPDIVTMDIIMPGIDGLETAKIILEEHPDARIIMISSLVYDDTINEAHDIGAKSFLYKPITRENLLQALNEALLHRVGYICRSCSVRRRAHARLIGEQAALDAPHEA